MRQHTAFGPFDFEGSAHDVVGNFGSNPAALAVDFIHLKIVYGSLLLLIVICLYSLGKWFTLPTNRTD